MLNNFTSNCLPENCSIIANLSDLNNEQAKQLSEYHVAYKDYLDNIFNERVVSIVNNIVIQSTGDNLNIRLNCPIHKIIIAITKKYMMNENELIYFAIYLDKFGWISPGYYIEASLNLTALTAKLYLNTNNTIIMNYLSITEPNIDKEFPQFINDKKKNNHDFNLTPREVNEKFKLLVKPINIYCRQNYLDLNFIVDEILNMSIPYSETRKEKNNSDDLSQQISSLNNVSVNNNNNNINNNNNKGIISSTANNNSLNNMLNPLIPAQQQNNNNTYLSAFNNPNNNGINNLMNFNPGLNGFPNNNNYINNRNTNISMLGKKTLNNDKPNFDKQNLNNNSFLNMLAPFNKLLSSSSNPNYNSSLNNINSLIVNNFNAFPNNNNSNNNNTNSNNINNSSSNIINSTQGDLGLNFGNPIGFPFLNPASKSLNNNNSNNININSKNTVNGKTQLTDKSKAGTVNSNVINGAKNSVLLGTKGDNTLNIKDTSSSNNNISHNSSQNNIQSTINNSDLDKLIPEVLNKKGSFGAQNNNYSGYLDIIKTINEYPNTSNNSLIYGGKNDSIMNINRLLQNNNSNLLDGDHHKQGKNL